MWKADFLWVIDGAGLGLGNGLVALKASEQRTTEIAGGLLKSIGRSTMVPRPRLRFGFFPQLAAHASR